MNLRSRAIRARTPSSNRTQRNKPRREMFKGLPVFRAIRLGERDTRNNASFYVKSEKDGKYRLYEKTHKTARKIRTIVPSASSSSRFFSANSGPKSKSKSKSKSSSSVSFFSARSKSKSKSKSSSRSLTASSEVVRRLKRQGRRLTRTLRSGELRRGACGKSRRTNRCRLLRGDEKPNKNCQLSSNGRCVKKPKMDRTKCGHSRKTNRCRYLRRDRKVSRRCKMSKGRCVKK